MCYYTQQSKTSLELKQFYNREIDNSDNVLQSDFINGFSYPNIPVILDNEPEIITTNFTWGLIPTNKDKDFRKNTLNARVETINEKASFSPSVNNRCLIIVSAYYDWHWNDPKGKSKTKFEVHSNIDKLFFLAGINNSWLDKNGETWNTYSIVTTEANDQMKHIHNRKEAENDQRMPIIINKLDEEAWLNAKNNPLEFAYPNYKPTIIAF